eukprot:GAHX01001483.1.p1 GENE.GAHX01001483.1~~GAHX01001483.1.p1  ORF type:complete len:357 (+),score=54.44 GAHX01001483.1:50-1120(+)
MRPASILKEITYLPNLIISGPIGSGRRELFLNLISRLFNHKGPINMTADTKTIKVSESSTKEVLVYSSKLFMEINASFLGIADYIPMQYLIKQIASTRQISASVSFRIILITDAELLSMQAQQSLRRTIEKFNKNARFVFITNNVDSLRPALQSRCLCVSNPAPTATDIKKALPDLKEESKVLKGLFGDNKKTLEIPDGVISELSFICNGNKKLALKMMELYIVSKFVNEPVKDLKELLPRWLINLRAISMQIVRSPNYQIIQRVRTTLQNVETSCFNPSLILTKLTEFIAANIDKQIAPLIFQIGAKYELNLLKTDKVIIQLEAFVAEVIYVLNKFKKDKKVEGILLYLNDKHHL